MDIKLNDFKPFFNNWETDKTDEFWPNTQEPKYSIDQSTGRKYLNYSEFNIRAKCVVLAIGTAFLHPLAALANVIYRTVKVVFLTHFWMPKDNEQTYCFKERAIEALIDVARIVVTPVITTTLSIAAIYAVINPLDGRKLYATLERAYYGNAILAPCFQPKK